MPLNFQTVNTWYSDFDGERDVKRDVNVDWDHDADTDSGTDTDGEGTANGPGNEDTDVDVGGSTDGDVGGYTDDNFDEDVSDENVVVGERVFEIAESSIDGRVCDRLSEDVIAEGQVALGRHGAVTVDGNGKSAPSLTETYAMACDLW